MFPATLLALLTLACSSTPNPKYYTLDMTRAATANPEINIEIGRLRPAEAVARAEIMILESPTQIEYYAADVWAANVGELVREKLVAEFGPPVPGSTTVILEGEILRFGQYDTNVGADAEIKIALTAVRPENRRGDVTLVRKTYELRTPAPSPAPKDIVETLSRSLETMANDIVRDIVEANRNTPPNT